MKKVMMLLLVSAGLLIAEETEKKFEYVGTKKCKICHKSEKSGNQWGKWSEGPHAKAFETLASEESKKIAEKMGIEDPQKSDKCLSCHNGWDGEEAVGCEDCHGPGSEYKSMKVMKGIFKGELKGEDYGLVTITEETCKKCHNENSPTYKEFKFEEFLKQIAHPVPEK